ncbi:hypothetical protein CP533_4865 [Ophiocordyceps camponoti-saundersi (nom. inval.)]|nr:hypothetical protein CP533_4865 [Ophiocordyceps camponoti-saundersi (nom. inval.)]
MSSRSLLRGGCRLRPLPSFSGSSPFFIRVSIASRLFTMAHRDPTTVSNYEAWRTRHTTVEFALDFDAKRLRGSVLLQLQSQTGRKSSEIILDTRFVTVSSVRIDATPAAWELKPHSQPLGAPLHIAVPDGASKGDSINVYIDLETTERCTALQWLTPAQTSSKKYPYVFSQCQAINARSIFPCQDTPDVKSTYTFKLTSILPVVASGVAVSPGAASPGVETVYHFEQKVPIPSYLFALASGDIATAPIGPRSLVATGPNELADCKWELEQDMEKFMDVAEKLVFPYKWGQYNVLVLPPSFPYGGMENPIYTFATPTIISGDRQNVDVIAHELSHSWSGNLVTNSSWEHFWLNEGWTVYLERRILGEMHGYAQFDFSAIIGWKGLEDAVEMFGRDHEYTKLVISHNNVDPEDVYSQVAYEKGFHFLYELERLVGRQNFDKFIPHYFTKWSEKSLDSFEFRDTFVQFFTDLGDDDITKKVDAIDWEAKFFTPDLPPKPDFDTSMVTACYDLAKKWGDDSFEPKAKDVEDLTANQKLVFLDNVQQAAPLSPERAQLLGKVYDFITTKNAELKTAYYLVALKARDPTCVYGVAELLGAVGRMKFVRPLFRELNKFKRQFALDTFARNKNFYHPICRGMVEKDLGIKE